MKRLLNITMMAVCCSLLLTACSSEEESDITITYRVLNEKGQECSEFYSGDEIVLYLAIKNSTEQTYKFADEKDLIKEAFLIYSSDGTCYNPIPYLDFRMLPISIAPGDVYERRVLWNQFPLPSGEYYSNCTLNIGKTNKSYLVKFNINAK